MYSNAFSDEWIAELRQELDQCQKKLRDLEVEWGLLPSAEKNHYKGKLNKYRNRYELLRSRFFEVEDRMMKKRETVRSYNQNTRYTILGNTEKLQ